ncbi:histone-like nucleoid-structuring protein Lsr2 [Jatrophihabitans sp. YIM 134969]
MSKQTITQLIDDIDGSEAEETIQFGIDGANYEIDLNAKNAGKLRDALATYIGHATPLRRTRPTASSSSRAASTSSPRADREQTQAIREWARASGYDVKDRGRIPAEIIDAYHAAK